MQRITSVINNAIERLRFKFVNGQTSQTLILFIEVTDSPTESTDNGQSRISVLKYNEKGSNNLQFAGSSRLLIRLSDECIEVDGSKTGPHTALLTEEIMTKVLKQHPRLAGVSQLVVTQHEQLSSVPVSIGQLMNLTILNLSANCLQDLPWSVVYLKKLKVLNLSDNCFHMIPLIVGSLANVEELLLSNNQLEYLPTSLLKLEKLRVLKVDGNTQLPQDLSTKGLDAILSHLQKRSERRNVWSRSTLFYTSPDTEGDTSIYRNGPYVKSLLEICVDSVLQFQIDFLKLSYVPHPLKRHLYDSKQANKQVAKCSKCHAYFSSQAYFDGHDCKI